MTVLLLADAETAAAGVREGLVLCAGTLIPSLFPFLVLSPMLVHGAASVIGRQDRALPALLCTFCMGMTAGFPIGAMMLVSLCEAGMLTCEDAQRLLGVCSGASAAFCVGYIGEALCGSVGIGWLVWWVQLILCLGGFLIVLPRVRPMRGEGLRQTPCPTLGECIAAAVPRMLSVSGTVIFFSVVRAFVMRCVGGIGGALLCGMCEMTGGLYELRCLADAGVLTVPASAVFGAGSLGFGGICVLTQITEAVSKARLSVKGYLAARAVLGIAASGCAYLLYILFFR